MSKGWLFHWDNAPVHTAKAVKTFLDKKGIKMLDHHPYSPDLAPADFFLFPTLKRELAGDFLGSNTFKKKCTPSPRTSLPWPSTGGHIAMTSAYM